MGMWSLVPRRCVFCRSAGTVVVVWRGDVVRSWHCRTCERYWPLSANEQQAFNRRTGPVDRRRATRARRSRT